MDVLILVLVVVAGILAAWALVGTAQRWAIPVAVLCLVAALLLPRLGA